MGTINASLPKAAIQVMEWHLAAGVQRQVHGMPRVRMHAMRPQQIRMHSLQMQKLRPGQKLHDRMISMRHSCKQRRAAKAIRLHHQPPCLIFAGCKASCACLCGNEHAHAECLHHRYAHSDVTCRNFARASRVASLHDTSLTACLTCSHLCQGAVRWAVIARAEGMQVAGKAAGGAAVLLLLLLLFCSLMLGLHHGQERAVVQPQQGWRL